MGKTLHALLQDQEEFLSELEDRLGYEFTDKQLLLTALIHSSFAFEHLDCQKHNETQEFLGDAVLDLILAHLLFKVFPTMREGNLTRIRASLVSEAGLSEMARKLDLGKYMLLGKGEEATGGRNKSSILSCGYEALMGGIFLDGGFPAAESVGQRFFLPLIKEREQELLSVDSKSGLQEILQDKYNQGPVYVLDGEEGPPHDRIFLVSVVFNDKVLGRGKARSKKEAEQLAAKEALSLLAKQGEVSDNA